jgi:Flp pilus assembly protein TadG
MLAIPALRRFLRNSRGTTVVEFAIVTPVFFLLVVGGLYACIGVFTATSLQYAVQQAARCSSVSTTCASSSSTITYATTSYHGPAAPAPTFTYATPACGHQVNGTVSFVFNLGISRSTVPINATACFP